MEVTVEHLGALQFEVKARQHVIVSDQPAANGGHDEGMTPPRTSAGFFRLVRCFLRGAVPAETQTGNRKHPRPGNRRQAERPRAY